MTDPQPAPVSEPMESDLDPQEREDLRELLGAVQSSVYGLRSVIGTIASEMHEVNETTRLSHQAIVTALNHLSDTAVRVHRTDCALKANCPGSKQFRERISDWMTAHRVELAAMMATLVMGLLITLTIATAPATDHQKSQPVERVIALPRAEPLEPENH